jgi:hypothetical protein
MPQLLKLSILDGPQVGQMVEVKGPRCSVGGKGSEADLELSGLPYGIKFVDLIDSGKAWTMVEFEPRTVLLNERQLKRRNKLSSGDTIWLPSTAKGQNFRLVAELETIKKQPGEKQASGVGQVNSTVLIGGAVYVLMMIGAAAYFTMNSGGGSGAPPIMAEDVQAALNADIGVLPARAEALNAPVPLTEIAADFNDLGAFMISGMSAPQKTALESEFRATVLELFSEAWRFEQQGRWNEARANYRQVIQMMGDRDLQTTSLALARLNQIQGR